MKNRKKPGKISKPDSFPENDIIISYLRSKPSIPWRNMVKIIYNLRFEKNPDESEKK